MAEVKLGGHQNRAYKYPGLVALVDDDLAEAVNQEKWFPDKTPRSFYAKHSKGLRIRLHNYIWFLVYNELPGHEEFIDHINGNGLDNRIENLRRVSRQQNNWNCRGQDKATSSIYKGVGYHKDRRKYQAYISLNRKKIYLGLFVTEEEAAIAYDLKAEELFGEYANLNFPDRSK